MKKSGFTLSELIVALGVIAVISAFVIPAIMNVMPDKYKVRVLNYHTSIATTTEALLANKGLYAPQMTYNAETGRYKQTCSGLACTQASVDGGYSGNSKYGNLLFKALDFDGSTHPDGSVWTVTKSGENHLISIDVDSKNSKNCYYKKNSCESPDTFRFKVNPLGKVEANDALTYAYLLNPENMNNRKEDLRVAKANAGKFK